MIAHEAIFEMRRELIASDRGDSQQAPLLEEAARWIEAESDSADPPVLLDVLVSPTGDLLVDRVIRKRIPGPDQPQLRLAVAGGANLQ